MARPRLRGIAGFVMPTAGTILMDSADVVAKAPSRHPVNTVFRDHALFLHPTVRSASYVPLFIQTGLTVELYLTTLPNHGNIDPESRSGPN
ncbi:MAG: hypothetical protein ACK4RZ_17330 [Paracoccaceae bacterium]